MAVACDPDLVVLDEPTTGLDVTTQEQILALLVDLRARLGTAMLYVTHDLGVLAQIADRVGVMYAGHMVETAPAAELFGAPRHPYTKGLVASVPRIDDPANAAQAMPLQGALRRRDLPPGCPFAPRCAFNEPSCWERRQVLEEVRADHQVACQRWRAVGEARAAEVIALRRPGRKPEPILSLQEITLAYGRQNGLLGRLLPAKSFVGGARPELPHRQGRDLRAGRRIRERQVDRRAGGQRVVAALRQGRSSSTARRSPDPTGTGRPSSGGASNTYSRIRMPRSIRARRSERSWRGRCSCFSDCRARRSTSASNARSPMSSSKRAMPRAMPISCRAASASASPSRRALIAEPELLLCDEILSALDVSVQANIIQLLRRLRAEHAISMLFISHDLAVVRSLADTVAVLFRGQLMEIGRNEDVFAPPYHPYTHSLLMAVPTIAAATEPPRKALRRRAPG